MLSVLEDIVDDDLSLDEKLITFWEDVIRSGLIGKDQISFNPLTPQELWMWRMNFRGLLFSKFKIPHEYIYPNIRINNLTSYGFKDTEVVNMSGVYIIDSDVLESIYEEYLTKYETKK